MCSALGLTNFAVVHKQETLEAVARERDDLRLQNASLQQQMSSLASVPLSDSTGSCSSPAGVADSDTAESTCSRGGVVGRVLKGLESYTKWDGVFDVLLLTLLAVKLWNCMAA